MGLSAVEQESMISRDRTCQKRKKESRGSLTKVLGLFLSDYQHRKLRHTQRGGLTQTNIFSLCLLVFPYSVLLRSTGGRKKGGQRGGGVFDGAGRERDRVIESSQTLNLWKYDGGQRCFQRCRVSL